MEKISGILKPVTRTVWKSDMPEKPQRLTDPREAFGQVPEMSTTAPVTRTAIERLKDDPESALHQPLPINGRGLILDKVA